MSFETFEMIGGKPTIDKSPISSLDYTLKFSPWLKGFAGKLTAASAVGDGVVVESCLLIPSSNSVRVQVSGGTIGQPASVTVTIQAVGALDGLARSDSRTIHFKIRNR
jgi:hypothetical protein